MAEVPLVRKRVECVRVGSVYRLVRVGTVGFETTHYRDRDRAQDADYEYRSEEQSIHLMPPFALTN